MKIYFERHGGFSGVKLTLALDLERLPQKEADFLLILIKDAELSDLFEKLQEPHSTDAFIYNISLTENDEKKTYQFLDRNLPVKINPLLHELTLRARNQNR